MGYKMKYSGTPFNFGEGTGRSPLSKYVEPPKKSTKGDEPGKVRSWGNPTGDHIDKQINKYGKYPHTAALPPEDVRKADPADPAGLSEKEPPTEKPSPAAKTSPLNQVRGQQQMNPSTLKPHVEHGTGRGSRTGKGIKRSHTV